MKINGSNFTDAMKFNHVVLEGNMIMIHNYDGVSMGVMTERQLEKSVDEKMEFILCEKDYKFISKLGDFDLNVTDKDIRVKTTNGKFKFARLMEAPEIEIDFDDMKPLEIDYELLSKASAFTGGNKENSATPQFTGVTILKDMLIASNRAAIMRKNNLVNDSGYEINIPVEAIKNMVDDKGLKFETNKKFLVCSSKDRKFYTTLLVQNISNPRLNLEKYNQFMISRQALLFELKTISEYADLVKFKCDEKQLNLIAQTESQEFDITLEVSHFVGKPIGISFNLKYLVKILNALEVEDVTIEINETALRIFDYAKENEFILARTGQVEM